MRMSMNGCVRVRVCVHVCAGHDRLSDKERNLLLATPPTSLPAPSPLIGNTPLYLGNENRCFEGDSAVMLEDDTHALKHAVSRHRLLLNVPLRGLSTSTD